MPDPLHQYFALSRTIHLTDEEARDIQCRVYAFVRSNPVRTAPAPTVLTTEEREAMFRDVYSCMRQTPLPQTTLTEEPCPVPQVFDGLMGANMLLYLQPFFLSEAQ